MPFRSYRSLLFKFWTFCVFEPPFGGLETTYDIHLRLIGKRVVDFLLVIIELLSLAVTAEELQAKIDRKSAISLQRGDIDPKLRSPPIIFAWIPGSMTNEYNFAADSFHTKKLCSRLSSSEVRL